MAFSTTPIAVYAAEEETNGIVLAFDLTSEEEHIVTVPTGTEITVVLKVKNPEASKKYTVTLMQNEVQFAHTFFEYMGDENVEKVICTTGKLNTTSENIHRVYMNHMTRKSYAPEQIVGSFKLKVTATSGSSVIESVNTYAYDDINTGYDIQKLDLTVVVGDDQSDVYTSNFYNDGSLYKSVTTIDGQMMEIPVGPNPQDGYVFKGWECGGDLLIPGGEIVVNSNLNFYAVWEKKDVDKLYTLTFESNGGTKIDSISAKENTVIDLSDYTPTRNGYTFKGWFLNGLLTNEVEEITLTEDTTVYAKWEKKESGGGGGGDTVKFEITFDTNGGEKDGLHRSSRKFRC